MTFRTAAAVAAALLLPSAASAQFTTFVAPPARTDTVVRVDTAAVVAVRADSISRANIANMKAWVDSAAGPGVDLGAQATATTTTTTSSGTVDTFADGAPAPDTATPLPMLIVLGAGAIAAGGALLRRR